MEELFTMILRKSRLGFNSGVVSMRNKWGELEGERKRSKREENTLKKIETEREGER